MLDFYSKQTFLIFLFSSLTNDELIPDFFFTSRIPGINWEENFGQLIKLENWDGPGTSQEIKISKNFLEGKLDGTRGMRHNFNGKAVMDHLGHSIVSQR